MNENHAQLCPSPEWAAFLHRDVLPGAVDGFDLGAQLLEIGPGPGAATEWLRHRVQHLVVVDTDADAVSRLVAKYGDGNVEVVHGDGAELPFPDACFDSAACFTMLHHVPTVALQDALLGEVLRTLRSGGVFVGSDSVPSDELAGFHEGDTYNPVDPTTFADRLRELGFEQVTVSAGDWLTFAARKPA